jgi:hypothetical protein
MRWRVGAFMLTARALGRFPQGRCDWADVGSERGGAAVTGIAWLLLGAWLAMMNSAANDQ